MVKRPFPGGAGGGEVLVHRPTCLGNCNFFRQHGSDDAQRLTARKPPLIAEPLQQLFSEKTSRIMHTPVIGSGNYLGRNAQGCNSSHVASGYDVGGLGTSYSHSWFDPGDVGKSVRPPNTTTLDPIRVTLWPNILGGKVPRSKSGKMG